MTEQKTTEELRLEYIKIRSWAIMGQDLTPGDFDRHVAKRGPDGMSPEQWVETAEIVPVVCRACDGTGQYAIGTENFKRKTRGICFRCSGKGSQTHRDRVRNDAYDRLNFHSGL